MRCASAAAGGNKRDSAAMIKRAFILQVSGFRVQASSRKLPKLQVTRSELEVPKIGTCHNAYEINRFFTNISE